MILVTPAILASPNPLSYPSAFIVGVATAAALIGERWGRRIALSLSIAGLVLSGLWYWFATDGFGKGTPWYDDMAEAAILAVAFLVAIVLLDLARRAARRGQPRPPDARRVSAARGATRSAPSSLRSQGHEPPLERPIEADDVLRWVDAHDAAWRANDATAIGALFSEDGVYHLGPWEGPWRGMDGPFRGRGAIVAGWLAGADTSERFTATTEILAIVGRRAIVSREITYLSPDHQPAERYGCVWLLDFDGAGRCREYQEWFVPDERLPAEPG